MTTKEKMRMLPTEEYIRRLIKKRNAGTEHCRLTTDVARDIGISAPDLNSFLTDAGILLRERATRELKIAPRYRGKGYTMTRSQFRYNSSGELTELRYPVWTEKGEEFIKRTIKKMTWRNK